MSVYIDCCTDIQYQPYHIETTQVIQERMRNFTKFSGRYHEQHILLTRHFDKRCRLHEETGFHLPCTLTPDHHPMVPHIWMIRCFSGMLLYAFSSIFHVLQLTLHADRRLIHTRDIISHAQPFRHRYGLRISMSGHCCVPGLHPHARGKRLQTKEDPNRDFRNEAALN